MNLALVTKSSEVPELKLNRTKASVLTFPLESIPVYQGKKEFKLSKGFLSFLRRGEALSSPCEVLYFSSFSYHTTSFWVSVGSTYYLSVKN